MRVLKREELKRRIDATNMKPFAFAKAHGIIYESLRRWLNGERDPKKENIVGLANALHCSVEDISFWQHEVNFARLNQTDAEFDELRAYWGYLSEDQRSSILNLIRSMAEPNMNSSNPDEPEK